MSTFQGLEIAKSGMMAYNASMQTTAHNLANVGTSGYSRQVVKTTAQTRHVSPIKVVGSGVLTLGIERQRYEYYDVKYQKGNSTYSKYSTHSYYLNEVQSRLYASEDKMGGITTSFDDFCSRLTGQTTDAGEETRRKEVVSYGDTFTRFVRETATNLQNLQEEANEEIKNCADQINAIAEKIVSITKQINTLEAYGGVANDLRDQRGVLLDDLSEYCNIRVLEEEPASGVGLPQFYVYVDGAVLIDTYRVNRMVVKESDTIKNINDIAGLYEVSWEDGSSFHPYSTGLGGKLQGLFEVRDGNNTTTLYAKASKLGNTADNYLTLEVNDASINDVQLLNIPASNGELQINGTTYDYKDFKVDVDANGKFTYTFTLKIKADADQAAVLQNAVNTGKMVTVGEPVNYKGVPYYMAQLNEFVRTYAQEFNDTHKDGFDVYGNEGIDFFNATVPTNGENYIFTRRTADGYDQSFTSEAQPNANGSYTGSYYYMTALNMCVTTAMQGDPNLFACNSRSLPGESENLNIQKLANLKDDSSMFLHGAPDSFLQSLTADVGVDCKKAITLERSQKNIRDAVEIQRQSVSGADEDEETENFLIFQKMLFNQYKVLSVMNEVLDKLINQTAI